MTVLFIDMKDEADCAEIAQGVDVTWEHNPAAFAEDTIFVGERAELEKIVVRYVSDKHDVNELDESEKEDFDHFLNLWDNVDALQERGLWARA